MIGEIRHADEIGKKGRVRYQWHACIDCGKKRWAQVQAVRFGANSRCRECMLNRQTVRQSGSNSRWWKGGKFATRQGYVLVTIPPDHKFACMRNANGQILEHRLVMAEMLDRPLSKNEIVHHKNGIKHDNRISNLEVKGWGDHIIEHSQGYSHGYDAGWEDGYKHFKELFDRMVSENAELKKQLRTAKRSTKKHHSRN